MTPGATFSFEVLGKDHEHITAGARQELKRYIGTEDDSVINHINYDISVIKYEDAYKATVTARVKL